MFFVFKVIFNFSKVLFKLVINSFRVEFMSIFLGLGRFVMLGIFFVVKLYFVD